VGSGAATASSEAQFEIGRKFIVTTDVLADQSALTLACCFPQEPGPSFTFVNPILDEAGSRHIAVAITHIVRETKESRQLPIVIEQVSQHLRCQQPLIVIVL
jgi:hypothetical protein